MKPFSSQKSALTLVVVFLLSTAAWTQCSDPSVPSVVICTPTPNSTVANIPDIGVRFTPAAGSTIEKMIIYDNSRKLWQGKPGQDGTDLYSVNVFHGRHNVTVNAWDTNGTLYQVKETFFTTGNNYAPCTPPKALGISLCYPPTSAILSTHPIVYAAATGTSTITNISFYVDDVYQSGFNGEEGGVIVTFPQQNAPYTVKAVATDADRHTYSVSRTLTAVYTYSGIECDSFGCTPGIQINAPLNEAYVGNTFDLNYQIVGNSNPISSMRVYLDNDIIATSNGPTLLQQVTVTPTGTHILTVQGWDTKGLEYRIQPNININVKVQ